MNINAISSYHKIKSDVQGNFMNHMPLAQYYKTATTKTVESQGTAGQTDAGQKTEQDQASVGARVWGNRLMRDARPQPTSTA